MKPTAEPYWAKPGIGIYSLALFLVAYGAAYLAHDSQTMLLLAGAVVTNTGTVINFYFGSSSSSQKKDETIAATRAP